MEPTETQIVALRLLGYKISFKSHLNVWTIEFGYDLVAVAYIDVSKTPLIWIVPYRFEADHMETLENVFGESHVV